MTKYESYAMRHAKQEPRALTPNPHSSLKPKSTSIHNNQNFIDELNGKASKMQFALLNERLLDMENKMSNLTNIVKLVQKYTETQDIQYEKQKKIAVGKESMLNGLIADHEEMMKRQQEYFLEMQETQRRIKEESVDGLVEDMGQKIRREMNMKIQILMNEIKDSGRSNNSFERMEMDQTKEKIMRLEGCILKNVSKKEFSKFKQDVNEEMENIVERFTRLIKKYMNSTSAGTPTKSPRNMSEKVIVHNFTLEKKDKQKGTSLERSSQRHSKMDKPTLRIGNQNDKGSKHVKIESEENIHPNIPQNKSPVSRSRSKSKQKSVSKGKSGLERNISPKLKITDKRKQKEAQLRQIIKHSKDKRSLR